MFKKVILFLVVSLFLVSLIGCQGKSEEAAKSSGETLTVWHVASGGAQEAIENAVARFEKEHSVEVEVIRHDNDPYKTNLSVAMGGGEPPDVFHSWGGGYLKEYVDAGQVKDITSELDKDNYLDVGLSMTTFNDKIYGAPLAMSLVPVWYNKEIFEKLNLEEPETYDELLTIIETLKSNDIIPFSLANQSKWPGAFYLMYFAERIGGIELFNSAFSREGAFNDPVYVEAGQKIQELVEMGAFPEGVNAMAYDVGQSRQLIYSEQAAMIVQTTNFLRDAHSEAPEFAGKLDFFLFPSIEGGKGSRTNLVGGLSPAFSVAEKTKNPELAVELVKELTSVETGQELADKANLVAAINGVEYEDPIVKDIEAALWESEGLQGFYDQTLPPELARVHLDTTQALFGLSQTPEEAADEVEKAAQEILD